MKRIVLTLALLCLVHFSSFPCPVISGLYGKPIAVDADGNPLFTSTTPPPGLVPPAVVIDDTGTNLVTSVQPPGGLVPPAVVIDDTGANLVTTVQPPPGLVDPRVLFDAEGRYRFENDGPALSVTGIVIMMALMLILGGYALRRRRTEQVP